MTAEDTKAADAHLLAVPGSASTEAIAPVAFTMAFEKYYKISLFLLLLTPGAVGGGGEDRQAAAERAGRGARGDPGELGRPLHWERRGGRGG